MKNSLTALFCFIGSKTVMGPYASFLPKNTHTVQFLTVESGALIIESSDRTMNVCQRSDNKQII